LADNELRKLLEALSIMAADLHRIPTGTANPDAVNAMIRSLERGVELTIESNLIRAKGIPGRAAQLAALAVAAFRESGVIATQLGANNCNL
jgi:hypothetical protein